ITKLESVEAELEKTVKERDALVVEVSALKEKISQQEEELRELPRSLRRRRKLIQPGFTWDLTGRRWWPRFLRWRVPCYVRLLIVRLNEGHRSIAGITDAMLDRLGFLPRGVNVPSQAGVLPGVYYGDGASLSKVFPRRAYSRPIAHFCLLSF
ncbi:hypothetical protein A2U01_0032417, partial [Trifolium medium]|nr:hypothetical protein [Trifolium medium]